jgi:hypothetical protein
VNVLSEICPKRYVGSSTPEPVCVVSDVRPVPGLHVQAADEKHAHHKIAHVNSNSYAWMRTGVKFATGIAMSLPRPVFPGVFYMITRRCTQQQFLMRPDDATNNNFLYCLGEAAQRFGIVVILPQMLSNHHHTCVYDPYGRINEFTEHFHKMFARCQNALRRRRENMWNSAPVCNVELIGLEDVLNKLVYTATNPVKDNLVEAVHHWPGPQTVAALLSGKILTARRPKHFFRENGKMPATVELRFEFPSILGDPAQLCEELARRIDAEVRAITAKRFAENRKVVGRARVLRQHWLDTPASRHDRRRRDDIRPRVAALSKWNRIAALQRNKQFIDAYRKSRAAWLSGLETVFPAGTYWLRRFMNVPVAPLVV